ncbi:YlxM family DNA-binding protein [Spiroplasma sp. BIUS-1]|uniref:YlxM family DNA-binding protein n=1 Tax=Spiroplasma sp. BIUS-1 TaxID=216964 RepID=UPI001397055B|nr:sigma factor-like helix-turn-helix DNA-binding protein [Spiroplasma sp. BIUS-1]QHX36900.1 DNA-binding protein [Spiroplasma sp. BIUS-1]
MINQDIQKTANLAELYDYYKNLLTEKQSQYFELYFFEDLTLQEISEEFGVSRNAIYDSISKTSATLVDLEDKLSLKAKNIKIKEILDKAKSKEITTQELIMELEKTL